VLHQKTHKQLAHSFSYIDDTPSVGIAKRGVQPSYARELDVSKDIPHVNTKNKTKKK
jgi:hypothetical protein